MVGSLRFDADRFVGFDIFTAANGINIGLASLRAGGLKGLHTVNLNTGAVTLSAGSTPTSYSDSPWR